MTRKFFGLLRAAFVNFNRHGTHLLAAAVSFYALLSLLPILYFLILLLGTAIGSSEQAVTEIVSHLHRVLPVPMPGIHRQLVVLVGGGSLPNGLALLSLLLGTGMAFRTLERSVAHIQGVRLSGKKLLGRIGWSYVMVLILAAAVVFTQVASGILHWARKKALILAGYDLGQLAGTVMARLGPVVTVAAGFFILLYLAPRIRFRVSWSVAVSLALTVIWFALRTLFQWYTANVVPFSLVYGPLASIMAFLIFVYLTAVLYLFAVEFLTAAEGEGGV